MNWYPPNNAKNLHGRLLEDNEKTVIFRNADSQAEEARVIVRHEKSVTVCAKSGDWLRLWFD